jgi:hypothetical protein
LVPLHTFAKTWHISIFLAKLNKLPHFRQKMTYIHVFGKI